MEHVRQIVAKAERLADNPRWYDALPMRVVTFLHRNGLTDLTEAEAAAAVAQLSPRELMAHRNIPDSGACHWR